MLFVYIGLLVAIGVLSGLNEELLGRNHRYYKRLRWTLSGALVVMVGVVGPLMAPELIRSNAWAYATISCGVGVGTIGATIGAISLFRKMKARSTRTR